MKLSHSLAFATLLLVPLVGCDSNDEIKVYQVDKETKTAPAPAVDPHAGIPMPTPGAPDPHAGLPMAGAGGAPKASQVTGEVPESWEAGRGSSMRLASYLARGEGEALADISLIVLAGGAGGVLDNVNRWRGQLGLDPVDAEGLAATSSTLKTPVGEGTAFDITSANPPADPTKDGRIVAVIVPLEREMWFYKMRGNADLLEREKEGFLRWVASARKAAPAPTPAANHPAPAPAPAPAPTPPAVAPQPPTEITWTAPLGWRQAPAKSMRIATFSVGAPETGAGEVSVIKLGGNGGGELANVNRWRGQIGLPPITAETLADTTTNVDSPAGTISMVDCAGSDKRILAAWLAHDGNTWFFKLTGPSGVVETEQARFTTFLSSLDFPKK